MLSRKDLNSAELETVRVSRNPTTDIIAIEDVQKNEEATVYVYDLNSAKITDIHMSGPAVKNHTLLKCQKLQCNTENYVPIVVPELSTASSSSTASIPPTSLPPDTTEFVKSNKNTTSKYQQFSTGKPVTRSYRNQKQK